MPDIAHTFGGDLTLSPTGDLAVADGAELTRERLLRRLLTNRGDYIWNVDYGAGLGAFIGQPANALRIRGVIRSQVLKEATVARSPAPVVVVTARYDNTVSARITYTDAPTGQPFTVAVL